MPVTSNLASNVDFVVDEADLSRFRFRQSPALPDADLHPNEVLIRVEKFGFSANNITYAVLGRSLRYFDFFPAQEQGWGTVPVWGMGTVVRSGHPNLGPGARMYGYFPLARYATLLPSTISATGFDVDHGPLAAVYSQYWLVGADPFHLVESEDQTMIFRPLIFTSILLDDYLADAERYFGADAVIISSASSKTSYGLAFMLARRQERRNGSGRRDVIGLTAGRNVPFVEGLGLYDRTITYAGLESISANMPVVFVDVAGNAGTLTQVREHFGTNLKASILVGMSHWDKSQGGDLRLGEGGEPVPTSLHTHTFFAPAWVERRLHDWGPAETMAKVSEGWREFMAGADDRCRIVYGSGQDAVAATYQAMLKGQPPPDQGFVLSLWDEAFSARDAKC